MKPSDPVKENLGRIPIKTEQFGTKIKNLGFPLFGCPEKSRIHAGHGLQDESRSFLKMIVPN